MRRAGIDEAPLARYRRLAADAKDGKLDAEAVALAISEIRTLLQKAEVEKTTLEGIEANKKDIVAAADARAAGLLALVCRQLDTQVTPQPNASGV